MRTRPNSKSRRTATDDLRSEYRFDYSKAKPNRFAGRIRHSPVVVLLDEDIARVFRTPESVRAVLRALIATMPGGRRRKPPTLRARA